MNRLIRITAATLVLGLGLSSVSVRAQGDSEPYSPGQTEDAVSYWLPRTDIVLTVHTRQTLFTPGEFSRYAERYLRLNDVRDKAEETWEITGITLSTKGTPDKGQLYTLTFKGNRPRPYIELTDDCILSCVNTQTVKETPMSVTVIPATEPAPKKSAQAYMTEEIIMSGSVAKMAELTAKEIYSIRESRNTIIRGQADNLPTDGESVKFFIEELDLQEEALLTLFNGQTQVREESFTIEISPEEPVSKLIAFRFSSKLGVLPMDNLAGEPVWIDISSNNLFPGTDNVQKRKSDRKSSMIGKKDSNQFLYCRIPGRAAVKVYNNREVFLTGEVPLAQFGSVEVVSSKIMGRQSDTRITFNTTTGAVKSINGN
ncbi:MAG: DUF4831 family protein [Bacteroidaceae bacterium]|nr:DUF4831 family protein [Bacteroidaceae bacterium]